MWRHYGMPTMRHFFIYFFQEIQKEDIEKDLGMMSSLGPGKVRFFLQKPINDIAYGWS